MSGNSPGTFQTVPYSQPPILCVASGHFNHVLKWEMGIEEVLQECDVSPVGLVALVGQAPQRIGPRALSVWCGSPVTLTHCRSHSASLGLSKHLPELAGPVVHLRVAGLQTTKEQTCWHSSCFSVQEFNTIGVPDMCTDSPSILLDPRTATGERPVRRRLPPTARNFLTSRPNRKNAALRLGPQLQGHVRSLDSVG